MRSPCTAGSPAHQAEVLCELGVLGVVAFYRDIGGGDLETFREVARVTQQLAALLHFHGFAIELIEAEQEDAIIDDERTHWNQWTLAWKAQMR